MNFTYPINIETTSEEDYKHVLKLLEEDGVLWNSGSIPTKLTYYHKTSRLSIDERKRMCFDFPSLITSYPYLLYNREETEIKLFPL